MRVLHLGKFFPPFAGGMEYFLADLLPALGQQGIQVAALIHDHRTGIFGNKTPAAERLPSSSYRIYRAPCYGRLLYAPISPQFPLRLACAIRDFKPDILHLHMPNTSAFWVLLIPSAKRIPWVIHWHSDVVASKLDRRLRLAYRAYRPLEQRLLAASHTIVATSPTYLASSQPLRSWQQKCHVIPMGLNPERISEPDRDTLCETRQIWKEDAFRVLAVGRLTYYKGHEFLIRAVAELPNLRLIIVGDGEYLPRLQILIKTLKLESKVSLLGFQTETKLSALFSTCDVVCLPSVERTEAFGLVLLEAMRFQKPVIASDIPGSGIGWAVQQGKHGLLVTPGDHGSLALALDRLARAPDQRNRLGRFGADALRESFHIDRIAEMIISLYQDVRF